VFFVVKGKETGTTKDTKSTKEEEKEFLNP
jgi:hypothetical protein